MGPSSGACCAQVAALLHESRRQPPDQLGAFLGSLVLAGVVARAVLAIQAQAPHGALAAELEQGGNFRDLVHQATGMVAVQLGVGEALVRLRAYAFGNDRLLDEVADEVVGRRLRFA